MESRSKDMRKQQGRSEPEVHGAELFSMLVSSGRSLVGPLLSVLGSLGTSSCMRVVPQRPIRACPRGLCPTRSELVFLRGLLWTSRQACWVCTSGTPDALHSFAPRAPHGCVWS